MFFSAQNPAREAYNCHSGVRSAPLAPRQFLATPTCSMEMCFAVTSAVTWSSVVITRQRRSATTVAANTELKELSQVK